jgi:hypothetical protein
MASVKIPRFFIAVDIPMLIPNPARHQESWPHAW